MAARLLDIPALARDWHRDLARDIDLWCSTGGAVPTLRTVGVGQDRSTTRSLLRMFRGCADVGIAVAHDEVSEWASDVEVTDLLVELSERPSVSGIVLMLAADVPHDRERLRASIAPVKNVEGDSLRSALIEDADVGHDPCLVAAVVEVLRIYKVRLAGARVAVIGSAEHVGAPLAQMLSVLDADVQLIAPDDQDARRHSASADVLVTAVGRQGVISEAWIKPGGVVIDVGADPELGVADVDFDDAWQRASLMTPVGGVAPLARVLMLRNILRAAQMLSAPALVAG